MQTALREYWLELLLTLVLVAAALYFVWIGYGLLPKSEPSEPRLFAGENAMAHVLAQTALGPRPSGSEAAVEARRYIMAELAAQGWSVVTQTLTYRGTELVNVVGRAGEGPPVVVGAHYDTRREADSDPDEERRGEPVLGANDGASGVAVLLELAYAVDLAQLKNEVWLAFFDGEDNGGLDGWDWAVGSAFMAEQWASGLPPGAVTSSGISRASRNVPLPEMIIVVDMIGDADQQIYIERNSTPELAEEIWALAADLGYAEFFINDLTVPIIDDHVPFLAQGVQAVDIIDFDYPYYHTVSDTADKVAPESLERVGRVLETFLEGGER